MEPKSKVRERIELPIDEALRAKGNIAEWIPGKERSACFLDINQTVDVHVSAMNEVTGKTGVSPKGEWWDYYMSKFIYKDWRIVFQKSTSIWSEMNTPYNPTSLFHKLVR